MTWTAALAAMSQGDAQSVETKAFATSQSTTTTVNATAKGDTGTAITPPGAPSSTETPPSSSTGAVVVGLAGMWVVAEVVGRAQRGGLAP